jgi:hypothetical protein
MVIPLCCVGFADKTESSRIVGMGRFGINYISVAVTLKLQFTEEMAEGGVNADPP